MTKTLHNTDANGAETNVPDIRKFGWPDRWELICKASSEAEGWTKSTKAMQIHNSGVLVLVSTQQRNPNGDYALAEALTFVPGASILPLKEGRGIFDREGREMAEAAAEGDGAVLPA